MSSAARNASNNALVAKLKRLTNKKQLLFGELTQKLNSIQAEYSSLEVVYETTLEQIDSLKDRSRVANLELRGHAGDLLQLQMAKARLAQRQRTMPQGVAAHSLWGCSLQLPKRRQQSAFSSEGRHRGLLRADIRN